jgi:hypothetical protein
MIVRALLAAAGLIALAGSCRGPREDRPASTQPGAVWNEAESATWRVRWRAEPWPPLFQETARLELLVAGPGGSFPAELRADAGMPEHGHGLLRHARVESLGPGHFALENLYLHMPGTWRVYLDLGRDGIFERVELVLEVD